MTLPYEKFSREWVINEWLPALRSRKYKQAHGVLALDEERMCCLGVACDILDPSLWRQGAESEGTIPIVWGDYTYHDHFKVDMREALNEIGWDIDLMREKTSQKLGRSADDLEDWGWSADTCLSYTNDTDESYTYAEVIALIEACLEEK